MNSPLDGAKLALGKGPLQEEMRGLVLLLLCCAALFVPTYVELYKSVWHSDSQGQGPIIIAMSGWLIWRKRGVLFALPAQASRAGGNALLVVAWLLYVVGRSQTVLQFEVSSHIVFIAALMLHWKGWRGLRTIWFALFFLIFAIPLPGVFVQAVTLPLKAAVSVVAEWLLYNLGFPIARSGVTLQIGPYQLLVADACAGLNSMFSLESLGLLYMNLAGYTSKLRNVLLATLIIPISFVSNVVRVIVLVLITYYYGDEAGQGFVHQFAGMVLFMVALVLMLGVDALLGRMMQRKPA